MIIQSNVSLKPYNSFGFDVPAEHFARVATLEDIREALDWARSNGVSVMPLGGGSNLVLSRPVKGLVMAIETRGVRTVSESSKAVEIEIQAGVVWHELVVECLASGHHGIENLALIPGRVGAAPIQNIGAYGVELCDVFSSLVAIDLETLESRTFNRDECRFAYRDSVFKQQADGRHLIVSVNLALQKSFEPRLTYSALARALEDRGIPEPGADDVVQTVCAVRGAKLPDPAALGNAGSFFTNPTIDAKRHQTLKSRHQDLVSYPLENGQFKLAAAWLIDYCGWKGHRAGEVGVHTDQALVLVNHGGGNGTELLNLATAIRQSVENEFGVALEIEPLVL